MPASIQTVANEWDPSSSGSSHLDCRLPWFGFDRLAVCDGGHGFGRRFARCLAKGLPVLLKRADVMCTVVYECVPLCTGMLAHVWEKKGSTGHAPLVVQGFTQIAVDHAREMLLVLGHCG